MWNKVEYQRQRKSATHVGYRIFLKYTAWFLYGIACACKFCKAKWNPVERRIEERHYNRIVYKLIIILKIVLIASQYLMYFVMFLAVYIHYSLVEKSSAQNFLMGTFAQGINYNVFRRLVIFLHLKQDRIFVRQTVNEILQISEDIEQKFGIIYHCDANLLGVYFLKLFLLYVYMVSYWYKSYFLLINLLYWLLLEYCFMGWFLYQQLLLNWYRNITIFLQRFIDDHKDRERILGRFHRRLFWLFELHLRINNLHRSINDNLSWLSTSIYLMIFVCSNRMELLIECIVFGEDELENKLYIIADGVLGPVLIPLLYVLLIGLCTDRLRDAELVLQQQIVIIHGLYIRKDPSRTLAIKVLYNEHTSLIIHQKLEPLQNLIILGTTCDREFAFDYLLTSILTAVSFVQYSLSCGDYPINECATHK
ncbi:uncharacterized protein CG1339 [Drosophila guanche]|uniref:Blast:Uncharacterized protein CG1339 n=1 Tax=Drosophila guanche TaxID=7266 RepID=A0A3B0KIB2_DROGU|nr:uncharacterized protein CG1339 [Drosophila guanche]SPP86149.1 blast:Uncharacterized protein CG1339 [Drosophila guanche]